ncbi:unnamed protein product [Effrenium voratum]|nr:unnamed protein product [Effrenium voratum]
MLPSAAPLLRGSPFRVRGWVAGDRLPRISGSWLPLPPTKIWAAAAASAVLRRARRGRGSSGHGSYRDEDEDLDLEELEEEVDEEMQKLRQRLELQPAPKRLPSTKNVPFIGHKRAPTDEQLEAMIEQEVPENRRNTGRFDPHYDNPLTKGVEIMTKAGKHLEHLVCCRGCGVPLQTHDPDNVGYVRFAKYLDKWASRLHRKLLCSRCLQLEKGSLVPVVKETLAEGQVGFGGQVVPADVLAAQLATIRKRRCLVVYVVDVLDFNGSFIRKIREIVGKNPVIIVGTKIDLLPPRTNMDLVKNWLLYILRKKKLRALEVQLVSNETGKGINYAVNAIIEHRSGMDVFVVGAANAGKSAFIRRLLDRLEVKFPQGKVENCERPLVSRTPGTTLGLIQMRAFRRSATSPVFAALYDTPGVHQPNSLQNLLDIERYNYVQPTRSFAVHTVTPAKDVLSELKASGEAVSQENLQQWLGRSVRYLWGFPGQDPVLAVEVFGPISAMLKLSFVGVHNLVVRCQANVPGAAENGRGYPDPPEDMELAQICYVKTPDKLSLDGKVMADLSLTGFGWVAVSFAALSAQAAGRPMDRSKVTIRVYGPQRLKVVENEFPVPVAGLPGTVPAPPEEELMGEDEWDADTMDEPAKVPSQPWTDGLGFSVGMLHAAPGGRTGTDKDEEAATEVAGAMRRPMLIDNERQLDEAQEAQNPAVEAQESAARRFPRYAPDSDPFDLPLGNMDLDDGELPMDDFEEEERSGPMPELAFGTSGGDATNPFGEDWQDLPVESSFTQQRRQPQAAKPPPRQRGKGHMWYGMTREEIKEAKAKAKNDKRQGREEGKSTFMRALEKANTVKVKSGSRPGSPKPGRPASGAKGGASGALKSKGGNVALRRRIVR